MSGLLLDTFKAKVGKRPPIWFMRQAGRALSSYQALRKKYRFETLLREPELTTKVTLLPLEALEVDAAILFSDILVVPQAMGMALQWTEKGPRFVQPLKERQEKIKGLGDHFDFFKPIFSAIEWINQEIPKDIPLIGFCGGPLTVMAYMVEGVGSDRGFPDVVRFIYQEPAQARDLLQKIVAMSIRYARGQVKAGIKVFQIFETWASILPWTIYRKQILPFVREITESLKGSGVPVIFFPRGAGLGLARGLNEIDCQGIGIDWQTPLKEARACLGESKVLQGNLDPRLLLPVCSQQVKRAALNELLEFAELKTPWIFNLGHGVIPGTKEDELKRTVAWVKEQDWGKQH